MLQIKISITRQSEKKQNETSDRDPQAGKKQWGANSSAYLDNGQFTPHIATKKVNRITVSVRESCIYLQRSFV